MSNNFCLYSGSSNVGLSNINEDFIMINEFDNDLIYASIADGLGATMKDVNSDAIDANPASIASIQTCQVLRRIYKKNKALFMENPRIFMEEAMLAANNILIGFKMANEQKYYGFASTLTALFLTEDGKVTFGHCGNTRIYLISKGRISQITKDHTLGQKMVDQGYMSQDEYYMSNEKKNLYNGLGIIPEPTIQTYSFQLKSNDILLMTSDGIHYSLREEGIFQILQDSDNPDDAVQSLINSVLNLKNHRDNISANVLWYIGENSL